ncbi:hypothetical protein GGS21DRAFT_196728 [Xylaria nigripes]|nr:hypothetical protein GGS21DRAFT_196728 [Xylaria nigripes]
MNMTRQPARDYPGDWRDHPRPSNRDSIRNISQDFTGTQSQGERVSLPPLHLAFPDLFSRVWSPETSPSAAPLDRTRPRRPITPPDYSHATPPGSHRKLPSYSHGTTPDYSFEAQPGYSPRTLWNGSDESPRDGSPRTSRNYSDEPPRDHLHATRQVYSPKTHRSNLGERACDFPVEDIRNYLFRAPPDSHRPDPHKRKRSPVDVNRIRQLNKSPRFHDDLLPAGRPLQSPVLELNPASTPWDPIRDSPLPHLISPISNEQHEQADTRRPTLPSIPTLGFQEGSDKHSHTQGHTNGSYTELPRRCSGDLSNGYCIDAHEARHWSAASSYDYRGRVRSLPAESARPHASVGNFHGPFAGYIPRLVRVDSYGVTMNGENRHRKRRGNLPKETTEKLRAWFVEHLTHPYPTEDEKQELMRQTNLQMNQISNWFINARRRHLPSMIHNALVETEATNGRARVSNSRARLRNSRSSDTNSRGKDTNLPADYKEKR